MTSYPLILAASTDNPRSVALALGIPALIIILIVVFGNSDRKK